MKKQFYLLILQLIVFSFAYDVEDLRGKCFQIERSVCLGDLKNELGLESSEINLIGEYKFDDSYGIDTSQMKNDIINVPKVGPQQGGQGYSAFFDQTGNTTTTIKHIPQYNTEDFSLSFWIFLIQDNNTGGWKTILHKGSTSQELTPSIILWPNSRRFHIRVSTDNNWNEDFDSNGLLPIRRWTQITLTMSTQLVQFYINGILDNQLILKGQLRHNDGDFHIGRDGWHSGPIFYLDDLKFYKTILKKSEIESLTYQPFSFISGDSYAKLGCLSCTYQEALNSCKDDYHLCTFSEIYAGAYQVARIQGWFRASMYFWTRVDLNSGQMLDEMKDPNVNKLGICCINKGF
ncbi:concanavalin A-like lectin/glucanase family protein (macronuclear) [Tetrahymena thermophila SB210]|uniref:Concanavalin A-like lectin/glucanase family protein n=1 Tax=Tetrahymena thermophila (strain SB210) TaxID=312017 RepID=I7MM25_TETTS|nr:concanavalin A-like lectin/glucanase family protein [Tetrahymena thermophila SB210]EAS03837.2 concanavalin A-like lectin/glucanase family protein [Tetrahymena thermophila SB210]|eukprot:XP_001024082.2 concanavalin A-like lectin/glucanase family protein [Tetrahymena thermophila SB210]